MCSYRSGLGLIYPRMAKDPMLLERALTELLLENKSFPCLEECVAKLEFFLDSLVVAMPRGSQ